MGLEIPEPLKWLAPIVVGQSWPEGDETKLRELRDGWKAAAAALDPVKQDTDAAARTALAHWSGSSADAFQTEWGKFTDGDQAYFKNLADTCTALANSCDQTALDIEYTKYMVIASLILLAWQIAMMIANAVETFGASTAGIPIAEVATRATVQSLFKDLVEKIAEQGFKKIALSLVKKIALNVVIMEGMDAGIQGLQFVEGNRKSWDWGKTGQAVAGGVAGGVVGAAGELIPKGATEALSGSVAGRIADQTVRGAARGAAEGAATVVGQAALTGQLGNLSAQSVLMGAAGGATGGAVGANKENPLGHTGDVSHSIMNRLSGDDPAATIEPSESHPNADSSVAEPVSTDHAQANASTAAEPAVAEPSARTDAAPTEPSATRDTVQSTVDSGGTAAREPGVPLSTDAQTGVPGATDHAAIPHEPAVDSTVESAAVTNPAPAESVAPAASDSITSAQDQSVPAHDSAVGMTSGTPVEPAARADGPVGPTDAATPSTGGSTGSGMAGSRTGSDGGYGSSGRTGPDADYGSGGVGRTGTGIGPSAGGRETGATGSAAPPADRPGGASTATQPDRVGGGWGSDTGTGRTGGMVTDGQASRGESSPAGPVREPGAGSATTSDYREASYGQAGSVPAGEDGVPGDRGSQQRGRAPEQTTQPTPAEGGYGSAAPPEDTGTSGRRTGETSGPRRDPRQDAPTGRDPQRRQTRAGDPQPEPRDASDRTPSGTGEQRPTRLADQRREGTPASADRSRTPVRSEPEPAEHRSEPEWPTNEPASETPAAQPEPAHDEGWSTHDWRQDQPHDQFAWASEAYDHFREDHGDIDAIAENLRDVVFDDGSVGFDAEQVADIKSHLFQDEHPIEDFDGSRVEFRRFDSDPEVADAWIRLRNGTASPEDLVLLRHEYAELTYLREHPEATYQEAHAYANERYNWQSLVPDAPFDDVNAHGENANGDASLFQEGNRSGTGDSLSLRSQPRSDESISAGQQGDLRANPRGRQGGLRVSDGLPEDHQPVSHTGELAREGDARRLTPWASGARSSDPAHPSRDLAQRTADPQANERRDAAVADAAQSLGLTDPGQVQALAHAYEVAREYTAPVIVDVAARIHDDLAEAVARDPDRRVVFLGRDGHSLALATRTMEPDFFTQHCSEVVLSRAVVESALRDLERNNVQFHGIDEFRLHKKIDDTLVPGAAQRLDDYLADQGVPINQDQARISLVDTSYKGTVQELLSALHPDAEFQGHYAFHGQEPTDPHPESKKGYLVDLGPEVGAGRPLGELTDDPALTWAHQDAIGVIEETLNGTMSSPLGFGPEGRPVQRPQRLEEDQTSGINPVKINEAFTDPRVREGAKAVAMRAVADAAAHAVSRREAGADWRGELDSAVQRTRDQVRAWVSDDPTVDRRFQEVMDSMVRRDDKKVVAQVAETIQRLGMDEGAARSVWEQYAQCTTKAERKRFAAELAERGGPS